MPADAVVLRAMAPKPQFAPAEAHAPAEAFAPSSGDKAQAKKTGEPVRVSVWDRAFTSLEQVLLMRGLHDGYAYELAVDGVLQLARNLPSPRLRVVYEVLDEPLRSQPGAEGHGGIEGLDRLPGEANDLYQERLRQIAKLARFMPLPRPFSRQARDAVDEAARWVHRIEEMLSPVPEGNECAASSLPPPSSWRRVPEPAAGPRPARLPRHRRHRRHGRPSRSRSRS